MSSGYATTPNSDALSIETKVRGRSATFFDFVAQIARPLTNIIVVSVTMNGGIRSSATNTPLHRPTTSPTASMTTTAAGTAHELPASSPVLSFITSAPVTLHSATTDPTER